MASDAHNRAKLTKWIHLLVDPLASAEGAEFRAKRNRYLFMICTALMTENELEFTKIVGNAHLSDNKKRKPVKVAGMKSSMVADPICDEFGIPVSIEKALEPSKLKRIETFPEWEREKCWELRLQTVRDGQKIGLKDSKMRINQQKVKKVTPMCSVHPAGCTQDNVDVKVGKCLDNQFRFLLHQIEYYQRDAMERKAMQSEKEKLNLWLQALAKVDEESCVQMKGIRNDYAMLLLGYLSDNDVRGPFEDFPGEQLLPLTEAIATYIAKRETKPKAKEAVPINPASDTVEDFMNSVPTVEEGAFAFFSLSGNLARAFRKS